MSRYLVVSLAGSLVSEFVDDNSNIGTQFIWLVVDTQTSLDSSEGTVFARSSSKTRAQAIAAALNASA